MKTVQIVGAAISTREDHTSDNPVWSFTGCMSEGFLKRLDLLLEIHDLESFEGTNSPTSTSTIEPWDWLYARVSQLRAHDSNFEILLDGETLDRLGWPPRRNVSSFPLDDIMNFYRLPLRGPEETRCRFFSSSPAYLMALAGYRGFDRVELYGIQASSAEEFLHQREGLGFWAGQLLGRGIDVWVPESCLLFGTSADRIYGFGENAMAMGRLELQGYVKEYEEAVTAIKSQMDELNGRYDELIGLVMDDPEDESQDTRLKDLEEQYRDAQERLMLNTGALLFGKFLLRRIDGISDDDNLPILGSGSTTTPEPDPVEGDKVVTG